MLVRLSSLAVVLAAGVAAAAPAVAQPTPNGAAGVPSHAPRSSSSQPGAPTGPSAAGTPQPGPPDLILTGDLKEASAARDAIRVRLQQGANCPKRPGDDALIARAQRALDRLKADRARPGANGGGELNAMIQDLSNWLDRFRRPVCAPAPRPPLHRTGYFLVEIKGTRSAFTEVEGLPTEVDALDYREGLDPPHVQVFPGLRRHPTLTLKRPWTGDPSLYFWFQTAQGGRNDRRDVTVTDTLAGMRRYNFHECWPMRWSGPSLNAKNSGHAVESIELSCERMDFR